MSERKITVECPHCKRKMPIEELIPTPRVGTRPDSKDISEVIDVLAGDRFRCPKCRKCLAITSIDRDMYKARVKKDRCPED